MTRAEFMQEVRDRVCFMHPELHLYYDSVTWRDSTALMVQLGVFQRCVLHDVPAESDGTMLMGRVNWQIFNGIVVRLIGAYNERS